jgi:hypothetical protein
MRNLLRSPVLAVILVPALAGVPSARAMATPSNLELCADYSGVCEVSGDPCVSKLDCSVPGERCLC